MRPLADNLLEKGWLRAGFVFTAAWIVSRIGAGRPIPAAPSVKEPLPRRTFDELDCAAVSDAWGGGAATESK